MNNEWAWKKAIELRRKFFEIYGKTGIISISDDDGIHVTAEELFQIPGKAKRRDRDGEYPVQLSKQYGDETFFAIMKDYDEYARLLPEEATP